MALPGQSMLRARPAEPVSRAAPDRRRYNRVAIVLLGRFMRESKLEYPCKLIDVSVGGCNLMAPVQPDMGEKIIAYFEQLGGLEGTVVRTFSGGFAMQFSITSHKREKLAETLMFLMNKNVHPGIEGRRHERIAVSTNTQSLTLTEGLVVSCEVTDLSISGASIVTPAKPEIGALVKLGNLNARVVRYHDRGIALEFVDLQNPNALRRYFG
jgi:hypothetical protein